MPSTPILGITQVSTSQSGKETTINDAIMALEEATNAKLEVSLAAGDATLTGGEATRNFIFKVVGATAPRALIFPSEVNGNPYNRVVVVRNESAHVLTVRFAAAGGSTVSVPNGQSRLISAADGTDMTVAAEPPSVISFLSLTDVPGTFAAQSGKFLAVNVAENALEFVNGAAWPSFTGNANKFLMLNSSETGVVWANPTFPDSFVELTDTPSSYSGQAGKLVRVNTAGTALEFSTPEEAEAVSYMAASRWRILALEPGIWPENPPGVLPGDPEYITPTNQVGFGEIEFLDQDGNDITGTGTASASNFSTGAEPSRAFNNNTDGGDGWYTEASYVGDAWIEYNFGTDVAPRKVRLTSINGLPQYGPMRFLIQYWSGTTWESLGDRTPAAWETAVPQTFKINGIPLNILPEAPVNGSLYARINGSWMKINAEVAPVTTTTYNLDATHTFQYRRFTNTGTKTLTIRTNAVHPMPIDGEWFIYNAAGAALTISPAAGVTVNPPAGGTLIVPLNGMVRIKRIDTDIYDIFGDTVSSTGASAGDIPALAGNANKLLAVKADNSGMEWIAPPVTYTDEQARDAVAAALVGGTNVTITHNDTANTITISASSIGLDAEGVRDTIAAALVGGTNVTITHNDTANTITITAAGLDAEGVRDTIAASLVAGSNVTIVHNDTANTITIAAAMDQEVIRDTVAATLVAGSNVLITHDDIANTITIDAVGGSGGGLDAETVRDVVAASLVAGTNISIAYDDTLDKITISSAGIDAESVRDTMATALVAGSNVTITPNDAADTITIAAAMDQEVIRDTIAAALVAGTNVTITHNDTANTITIDASAASTDPEVVRDTMAAALVAGANVTITPNDLGDTITIAASAGLDAEGVRDTIASALVAGANVSIVHNDAANTITITATTDAEVVRDTMATALVAGTGVTITPNDAADTITITAATDPEVVRDTIAAALVAGAGITITPNDVGDTITISTDGVGSLAELSDVNMTTPPTDGQALVWDSTTSKWVPVNVATGGPGDAAFSGAIVYASADQAISSGTPTALVFNQEVYDTDTYHDPVTNPSRLTVPLGIQRVRVGARVARSDVTGQLVVSIRKNGTTTYGGLPEADTDTAGTDHVVIWSPALEVAAGDYFEVFVTSDTACDVIAGSNSTWFALEGVEGMPNTEVAVPLIAARVSASGTTAQSIGATTPVRVTNITTEELNNGGFGTTGAQITIPPGVTHVRVTGGVYCTTTVTSGSSFSVQILLNGSAVEATNQGTGYTNHRQQVITRIIPVVEGDIFSLYCQSNDSSYTVAANTATFLEVQAVAGTKVAVGTAGGSGGGEALPDKTGKAGKVLAVNSTEDGLEWVTGGGGAAAIATEFDISIFSPGVPASEDEVAIYIAARDFKLFATLPDSSAYAGTAPTGEVIFTIKKNTTTIGTITFPYGTSTGTFSFASDVTFFTGDRLSIIAPTGLQNLADLSITFAGSRL